MSPLKKLSILSVSLLVAVAFSACEKKGTAEKVGEKIDNTVEKVQDTVNPKGPMEKAGEKIDETVDKTKEAVKK
jgi:PBP1b-binding outer membrane lipoprotein LpoB